MPENKCQYCHSDQCGSILWKRKRMQAVCTRKKGHSGDHVACGDKHEVKKWVNADE